MRFADTSEAESFRAPLWFGPELAPEESCEPRAIALGRRPKTVDTTIQNAALEALIDHLDARSGRGGGARGLDDPLMGTLRRLMRAPEQVATARQGKAKAVPAQGRNEGGDDDQVFEAAAAAASRGTSGVQG